MEFINKINTQMIINNPSSAIELTDTAASSISSVPSTSSPTPLKTKKGGRAYGSKSEVTPINADHLLPFLLITHIISLLFWYISRVVSCGILVSLQMWSDI